MPDGAPRETSSVWITPEHFGQDTDKPQNWVDSDNEEEDEGGDEDGTVNWSKQNSYTLPSIDRHSLSSGSSRSHTETGTVRGWALSLVIPNVSSGDSLNDDTLVDTTNSAEPEDEEDELEERRVSIGFSGTHYQTTSFDLDAFRASAIFVQQRRHSQAPTTLPTVADPPSPPSALRLDTKDIQYDSTWSDDSDGKSSRRTSLLSEDQGDPRSEYQELEVVNTQPPLRGEFQLVCAFAFVRSLLNPDWRCFLRLFRRHLPSLQTGRAKEDRTDSLPVHKAPIPIPAPRDQPMNQNQNQHSTHPYAFLLNTTKATPSMLIFHPNAHLPTQTTTNSRDSSQSRRSRLNPPLQTRKSRPFKRGSAFTRRSHWSRRS